MTRWQIETSSPGEDDRVRRLVAGLGESSRAEAFTPGHRTLVTGGARSGKSALAESMVATLAADAPAVDYVATSAPAGEDDPDWAERIRIHRARRPASWTTIETLDVAAVLADRSPVPVLVDCLGVWLTRTMDETGAWLETPGWHDRLDAARSRLVEAVARTERTVVFVTNEVGSGVVPATASGRAFRDELGRLNAQVAAACDRVWLCVAGVPLLLKDAAPDLGRP